MRQTIYVVDDNEYVREALVMLIEDEADLEVCGTSETAAEALVHIPDAHPNLILVDLALPGMNGIELIERLLALDPVLCCAVVSGHAEPEYAAQALAAGARGYIRKGEPQDILAGIRHVLSGEVYVSPTMLASLLRRVVLSA